MLTGYKTTQKKSIKEILTTKGDNNTDGIGISNEVEVLKDEEIQETSISISFFWVILQTCLQLVKKIR